MDPERTTENLPESSKLRIKQRIFDLLVSDDEEIEGSPQGHEKLLKSLAFIDDEPYLQRLLDVVEALNTDDFSKNFDYWDIARSMRGRDKIEIAHRNLHLMKGGPNLSTGFSAVNDLHRAIAEYRNPERPRTVVVEQMGSHLTVWNLLRMSNLFPDQRDYEYYTTEISDIVARHPEHPERLAKYLLERGTATFDDEAYSEYLKVTAPLAEGAL